MQVTHLGGACDGALTALAATRRRSRRLARRLVRRRLRGPVRAGRRPAHPAVHLRPAPGNAAAAGLLATCPDVRRLARPAPADVGADGARAGWRVPAAVAWRYAAGGIRTARR